MFDKLSEILGRNAQHLVQDAIGASTLLVVLVVGMNLNSLI